LSQTKLIKRCETCQKELSKDAYHNKRFCDECSYKKRKERNLNRYYISLGTIIRNICIKKKHQLYIKKTHLRLSTFIQEKLDEKMEQEKHK